MKIYNDTKEISFEIDGKKFSLNAQHVTFDQKVVTLQASSNPHLGWEGFLAPFWSTLSGREIKKELICV